MTKREAKSRVGGTVESGVGRRNLANSCVRKSGTCLEDGGDVIGEGGGDVEGDGSGAAQESGVESRVLPDGRGVPM